MGQFCGKPRGISTAHALRRSFPSAQALNEAAEFIHPRARPYEPWSRLTPACVEIQPRLG